MYTVLRLQCQHNWLTCNRPPSAAQSCVNVVYRMSEEPCSWRNSHLPRRLAPELEGKILDAAQKLWKKGGEKALTMRAVAKAAGTNTPSVYRRFRDRNDI